MTATHVLLPSADRRTTVAGLRRRLRPLRALLLWAVGLFFGRSLAGLAGPAVLGHIVDLVVDGADPSAVTGPVLLLVAAALVEGLFAFAAPAVAAHGCEPALADLREDVVDRALRVPLGDIERAGTGDLVARVDGDVSKVSDAIKGAFPAVAESALTVGLTVIGLAFLDWRLALAGLCAVPIQWNTVRWYLPRSNPVYAAERAAAGERSGQLLETIAGADTVRAFDLADSHSAKVAGRSRTAVELMVSATRLRTRFFGRLNLAEFVGLGAILLTGFWLVRNGDASVGAVTAAALYFQRLFDPINGLLYLLDEAQAAIAALARLVGVADMPGEAPVAAVDIPAAAATVAFDGVDFAYQPDHLVLHGLGLRVEAGQRVAVVGASGAGKTTVAKLVAGVHDPVSGSVTIGGVAPGAVAVALVTQEVHVFAGTLADDLRLAAPTATDADLGQALTTVGALGWVRALPAGIETLVGDGGHPLTTTQAQHLALARLVLADPVVAVLDEATAEAGSAGARILEAAAAAAVAGRTSLVVAHRLTQAATADRIVVLDAGRLVEEGTHDELVAAGGRYAELWTAWSDRRPPS